MTQEADSAEHNGEGAWVRRAQRGDPEAFACLCETHRARLWRVASAAAKNRAEAEDIAQEAVVRAFASFSRFRGESSFGAWLCRIAVNVAHDKRRSAWHRRVFLWERDSDAERSGGVVDGPQGEAERRETQRRVRYAVAALCERERVPLYLVYFEEFSVAEVARLEGVPESTLRSRIKAGLARLARTLKDWETPGSAERERQEEGHKGHTGHTGAGAVSEARFSL